MTGEPIESVPSDLEQDPLLAGATEAVKAFELGRRVGGLGVTDDNYWRGFSEGLSQGYDLGRLPEDERRDTIDMALNGGSVGLADHDLHSVESYRAPRCHEVWEIHPASPYSRGRRHRAVSRADHS